MARWRDYRPWRHEIETVWTPEGPRFFLRSRRKPGTAADVENFEEKLTALMALRYPDGCVDGECDHYLERNRAVAEAELRISARQERQVRSRVWRRRP